MDLFGDDHLRRRTGHIGRKMWSLVSGDHARSDRSSIRSRARPFSPSAARRISDTEQAMQADRCPASARLLRARWTSTALDSEQPQMEGRRKDDEPSQASNPSSVSGRMRGRAACCCRRRMNPSAATAPRKHCGLGGGR